MKTTLHSQLFNNIPQPDSYTMFSCDYLDNYLDDFDDKQRQIYWDNFEHSKWLNAICKAWEETIYSILYQLDKNVKVGDFKDVHSPYQYNYSTDSCAVDVEIDDEKYLNLLRESTADKNGKFSKYLKKFYSSRSGFISFYPNNIDDFLKSDSETQIHILIDYFAYNEYKDDFLTEIMYENLNIQPLEYLNYSEESKKLIESI